MYLPIWIRLYRVAFGALALWAVYDKRQASPFSTHFWDFFTNQSGVVVGVVLLLGGAAFAQREPPLWWEYLRGAGIVVAVLTGVVFAVLLDGLYNPITTTPRFWQDTVFHQVLPLVMLADLAIVPLHRRVGRAALVIFPLYPFAYLLYCLRLGESTGWYAYRFMDPYAIGRYAPVSGWAGVALTNGVLLLGVLLLTVAMIRFSRWRRTAPLLAPATTRDLSEAR